MTMFHSSATDIPQAQEMLNLAPARIGVASKTRSRAGISILVIGVLLVAAFAGALVAGTIPRQGRERDANAAAAAVATAQPRVTVAVARRATLTTEQTLPGNSLPLLEAAIYSRATGYVKSRLVDIGDRVEAGQLLAVIDAPDLDDQLAQAKANLDQAKANLVKAKADEVYAKNQMDRYQQLVKTQSISATEYDSAVASYGVAEATVVAMAAAIKVNDATVRRYSDLQRFEKITAPFSGVITARHIDPGDLVSADSTAQELFHVMRTDTLRVFVNVPQTFAQGIKVGQGAVVYRRNDPQKQHGGKVTRTADALDANTRTLLTEVQVPNSDNALRPGMYLQVKFVFERSIVPVRIPATAVTTRAEGPRVAILDDQHRVHYRAVQLGRDFGEEIEVIAGLNDGDTVVVRTGDDISEGTLVEPVSQSK
jgi:RND family efflux transporter MFP subunit